MPTAFVLMPFDEDFDAVYTHFLTPILSNHGVDVRRADDIEVESQQNILRDVVRGIATSDLIVADLTTANPNVFYELGIAHALRKQTILITQSIDDVPFDLRPYRLLEYSTHFVRIQEARERLSALVSGHLRGTTSGSPITDFLPSAVVALPTTAAVTRAEDHQPVHDTRDPRGDGTSSDDAGMDSDDRGFLDHLIDVTDGYGRISELISGFSGDLNELTAALSSATGDFNQISASPGASSPIAARRVARRLAEKIKAFNSELSEVNREYSEIARETEDSLEFMVSFQSDHASDENAIDNQLSSLRELRSTIEGARESQLRLAESMERTPRIERRLNREVSRGSEGIRVLASNLDRTIASISRALAHHEE